MELKKKILYVIMFSLLTVTIIYAIEQKQYVNINMMGNSIINITWTNTTKINTTHICFAGSCRTTWYTYNATYDAYTDTANTTEEIQDSMDAFNGLEGVTYTYDDTLNKFNFTFDCSEVTDSASDHLGCSGEDLVVSDDWYDAVADFSTTLTDGYWCRYSSSGTEINCDVSPVTDTANTTEEMQDATGAMAGSHLTYTDASNDLSVADDWWDADADISADEISESKISFSTACASGNHYYLSGNDLGCESDDDSPDDDSEVPNDITIDSSGKTHKVDDNDKFYFGTGDDVPLYFNGTCFLIEGPTSTLEIC